MTPPTAADPRDKLFEAALRRHGGDAHALIEVLHAAQELYGYLSVDLLRRVARVLDVPESRVYGVASFYHFFSLVPKGRHSCVVCLGTACYVKRGAEVLAALEREFGVRAEHVTADGALSLGVARCFGACGLAPAVVLDGQVKGRLAPDSIVEWVRSSLAGGGPGASPHAAAAEVGGSEAR